MEIFRDFESSKYGDEVILVSLTATEPVFSLFKNRLKEQLSMMPEVEKRSFEKNLHDAGKVKETKKSEVRKLAVELLERNFIH